VLHHLLRPYVRLVSSQPAAEVASGRATIMAKQRESTRRSVKLPALIGGVLTVGTMLLAAPAASVAFAPTAFAAPPSDPGPGTPGAPGGGITEPGTAAARGIAPLPSTFTSTGTGSLGDGSVDRNRSRQHHGVHPCLKIPAIGKC